MADAYGYVVANFRWLRNLERIHAGSCAPRHTDVVVIVMQVARRGLNLQVPGTRPGYSFGRHSSLYARLQTRYRLGCTGNCRGKHDQVARNTICKGAAIAWQYVDPLAFPWVQRTIWQALEGVVTICIVVDVRQDYRLIHRVLNCEARTGELLDLHCVEAYSKVVRITDHIPAIVQRNSERSGGIGGTIRVVRQRRRRLHEVCNAEWSQS